MSVPIWYMIHLSSEFFKGKASQFVFITGCVIDMVTMMRTVDGADFPA